MSLPQEVPESPSRGRRILRRLLWGCVALYFAFGGAVLVLRYGVLPNIDAQRARIEGMATRALGRPVQIGSLVGDWSGLRPQVHLRQITLSDDAGQPALQLEEVDAVLGWASLVLLRPYFHRIELHTPRLILRREADGQLFVAGLPVALDSKQPGFAEWLLSQGTIVVRDARLEWTDVQRGAPHLALENVGFELHNFGGHHRFGLQAQPPAALATTVDLRGDLHGHDLAQGADWRGAVYAKVGGTDLAAFKPWIDLPYEAAGRGDVQIWGEMAKGRLVAMTADLSLVSAGVRLGAQLPPLDLVSVAGRVSLSDVSGVRSLVLAGVSLATREGITLPTTDLRLEMRQGAKQGGSFRASQLDLASLARLAVHIPLAPAVVDRLAAFDPAGRIRDAQVEWTGPLDALASWKLKADFEGIGLRAWKRIPGVSGLSGDVEGSEGQGRVRINSKDVVVELPEVFSDPRLQLANVRAEGGWERRNGELALSLDKAEFDNQDASGQASGTYRPTDTGPGVIDLQARLTRAKGAAVWRYMPLVVNRDTRDWLQRSIVGGTAQDARLRLKGDLKDFPFVGGKGGQFQVRARMAGARLEYASGWPPIDGIDGELLFEGAMMKITADRGQIFGVKLADVTTVLPDLAAPEEVITIKGRAAGATADFLRYVSESPVADRIQHFTDDMRAEGNGTLNLELVMPLRHLADTGVKGEFKFAANRLTVVSQLPPVTDASGRVQFTATSLAVPEASGRLFGEPVRITGQTRADGAVVFNAAGAITPTAASQTWPGPWWAHLSGTTAWRSEIQVLGRGATVQVDTTLKGLASSLPVPFNKSALEEWPLRVEMDLQAAGKEDRIRASLGDLGRMEVVAAGDGQDWRVIRGDIAIRQPLKLPEKGLSLRVNLPEMDLDAWRRLGRGAGAGGAGPSEENPVALTAVSLQADKVQAMGETLREFNLQATARPDGWQGNLKSRETEGEFRWQSKGEGTLTARLFRLAVTGGKGGSGGDEPDVATARSLPALDVTVQQFVVRDKSLGRLALLARNQGGVWFLDSVNLTNPDGSLSAKGVWRPGHDERTELDFKLETGDVGKFLTRLDFADAVRRGKASLAGKVQWSGSPSGIDYPSLEGQMEVQAEGGQFRKLEPGVGRLLGVLSLQSLPRRITLDFRDVFSEGFAFDRISGSILVKGGVLRTDDLEIRGPAARVRLRGVADVAQETQDLVVDVQPTLSESVAVGAAAGLLNPAVGVVAYLAQKALSDPIEKLFAYSYRVTGQWQDPKVEKISTRAPESSR